MTPIDQTRFYEPDLPVDQQRGNCLQAVLASLLDLPLEGVPHFVQDDVNSGGRLNWWAEMRKWLQARGWGLHGADLDTHPGEHLMASGPSPRGRGIHHVVIYRDRQMVHDPHPDRTGLVSIHACWGESRGRDHARTAWSSSRCRPRRPGRRRPSAADPSRSAIPPSRNRAGTAAVLTAATSSPTARASGPAPAAWSPATRAAGTAHPPSAGAATARGGHRRRRSTTQPRSRSSTTSSSGEPDDPHDSTPPAAGHLPRRVGREAARHPGLGMTGGQHRHGLRLWSGHAGDGKVAVGVAGAQTREDQDIAFEVAREKCVQSAGKHRAGPVQQLFWDYHRDGHAVLSSLGVTLDAKLHAFLRESATSVLVVALALTDRPHRYGRRNR